MADEDPTTPEAQAAYWKGAYERMAARNLIQADDFDARLSLRDTFITEKGLWHEFATTVLSRPAALASHQMKDA